MVATLYCLVCGTPTTTLCSSCKTGSYCSKEHQKQDWKSHKEYCLQIKAAENTYNAILFHANETKPRLIKLPWVMGPPVKGEEIHVPWEKVDKSLWFKHPKSFIRSKYFNQVGMKPIGRSLCFSYDDNFMINGSPLNRCVMAVTGGTAGHEWAGNIVGLRVKHDLSRYLYDFYADANMEEDLKAFTQYFIEYGT